MLLGDFNADELEPCLSQFRFEMNAKSVVKEPTCFKSLSSPSCIDIAITNSSSNFQNTKVILTGLLDFHKIRGVTTSISLGGFVKSWTSYPGPKFDLMFRLQ